MIALYHIHHNFTCSAGSVSCEVGYANGYAEGSTRLDPQDSGRNISNNMYYLLQVCLFGQWSYVCSDSFDDNDLSVALHQLGSIQGGS